MRTWIVVGISAVLGVAVGLGLAWVRVERSPCIPDPFHQGGISPDAGPDGNDASPPAPKVAVSSDTYEFGVMDQGATGSHEFVFTNEGRAALKLTSGESTCGCTLTKLVNPVIEPGQTGKVIVEWAPK